MSSLLYGLTATRIGPIAVKMLSSAYLSRKLCSTAPVLTSGSITRSWVELVGSPVKGRKSANCSSLRVRLLLTPSGAERRSICTLPPNFSSTLAMTQASLCGWHTSLRSWTRPCYSALNRTHSKLTRLPLRARNAQRLPSSRISAH